MKSQSLFLVGIVNVRNLLTGQRQKLLKIQVAELNIPVLIVGTHITNEPLDNPFGGVDMREIKFRAWDKDLNRMRTVHSLYWTHEGFSIAVQDPPQIRVKLIVSEFILMQFTGLKDKNGREIFEGDIIGVIVKRPNDAGHDFIKSVVKYEKGRFCADYWNDGSTWCEVIGNIYENPELLNDPKA